MNKNSKTSKAIQGLILAIIFTLNISDMKAQDYRSAKEAEGLSAGTAAPVFNALDANNNTFSLETALEQGPVVLIFYRGFWCPVCNKHLSKIQDSLKLIEEKGAKVIAISPEKPEYLGKMEKKSGAEFTLLYDEGYKISDAYDVTFKPSKATLITYNTMLGAKLKKTHSDDSQRLPIPATYVIDKSGTITWRQFNPDYKKRSNVADILEALDKI
ncbi:MAG: peroxiredoxin-like family protein [Bacteroidota bacterium]